MEITVLTYDSREATFDGEDGERIAEAESKVILKHAQAIGQVVRGEDGVGNAFRLTESYVSGLN